MRAKKIVLATGLFVTVSLVTGCANVGDHRQAIRDSSDEKLTLGVAQREIKVGMSPNFFWCTALCVGDLRRVSGAYAFPLNGSAALHRAPRRPTPNLTHHAYCR